MECAEVRLHLLDLHKGRIPPALRQEIERHLATCEACRRADAEERLLTDLLADRLPRYSLPVELRQRLASRWLPQAVPERPRRPRRVALAGIIGAAAGLVIGLASGAGIRWRAGSTPPGLFGLEREAVNDHLRVLYSQHPLEVLSSNMHQVRPWFEGRLDFAPAVPFPGDGEFVLEGGAVGYLLDRQAAVLVYKLRLHAITLLVFKANGLPWPSGSAPPKEGVPERPARVNGFNVLLWQQAGLGYALVSDAEGDDLVRLARRVSEQ